MPEDEWTVEYDNHGNGGFSEWFDIGPVRVSIGYELTHDEAESLARAIAQLMKDRNTQSAA